MDQEAFNAAHCLQKKGTRLTLNLRSGNTGLYTSGSIQEVHQTPLGLEIVVRELRPVSQEAPDMIGTWEKIPGYQDPQAPKPFTPNNYTRYIPTLDGRCVPVDVYCVSEAFPLANCLKSQGAVDAVNHARKKLLAPGQRGTKSSIQDVKEAHASLGRAIEIEEAALGREGKEA